MAAPDLTLARPGQVNGSGSADTNFLKLFGGETLTAFRETNVALANTIVRNISQGKSAQFELSRY